MQKKPFHSVALAFGANLGDAAATISEALVRLQAGGLAEMQVSDLFKTRPLGCVPGTPPFLNGAVTGLWPGSPHELLRLCQRLEVAAGRPAEHASDQARVLDLDILLFGHLVLTLPELTLPHPRLGERLFVLAPLAQIAPAWVVPGTGRTVDELRLHEEERFGSADWGHRVAGPPTIGRS
ncbi:MAG: 2-amino-4-hydroxy-6-hydroxymethyldihydropteridine diphosphokinase [Lentisphaeria bacterium]|nr:2-amino-4-hydroxy-6-hydroxymethyldihydropteridine diphosphokinase [Lentisphaeria bacterium]